MDSSTIRPVCPGELPSKRSELFKYIGNKLLDIADKYDTIVKNSSTDSNSVYLGKFDSSRKKERIKKKVKKGKRRHTKRLIFPFKMTQTRSDRYFHQQSRRILRNGKSAFMQNNSFAGLLHSDSVKNQIDITDVNSELPSNPISLPDIVPRQELGGVKICFETLSDVMPAFNKTVSFADDKEVEDNVIYNRSICSKSYSAVECNGREEKSMSSPGSRTKLYNYVNNFNLSKFTEDNILTNKSIDATETVVLQTSDCAIEMEESYLNNKNIKPLDEIVISSVEKAIIVGNNVQSSNYLQKIYKCICCISPSILEKPPTAFTIFKHPCSICPCHKLSISNSPENLNNNKLFPLSTYKLILASDLKVCLVPGTAEESFKGLNTLHTIDIYSNKKDMYFFNENNYSGKTSSLVHLDVFDNSETCGSNLPDATNRLISELKAVNILSDGPHQNLAVFKSPNIFSSENNVEAIKSPNLVENSTKAFLLKSNLKNNSSIRNSMRKSTCISTSKNLSNKQIDCDTHERNTSVLMKNYNNSDSYSLTKDKSSVNNLCSKGNVQNNIEAIESPNLTESSTKDFLLISDHKNNSSIRTRIGENTCGSISKNLSNKQIDCDTHKRNTSVLMKNYGSYISYSLTKDASSMNNLDYKGKVFKISKDTLHSGKVSQITRVNDHALQTKSLSSSKDINPKFTDLSNCYKDIFINGPNHSSSIKSMHKVRLCNSNEVGYFDDSSPVLKSIKTKTFKDMSNDKVNGSNCEIDPNNVSCKSISSCALTNKLPYVKKSDTLLKNLSEFKNCSINPCTFLEKNAHLSQFNDSLKFKTLSLKRDKCNTEKNFSMSTLVNNSSNKSVSYNTNFTFSNERVTLSRSYSNLFRQHKRKFNLVNNDTCNFSNSNCIVSKFDSEVAANSKKQHCRVTSESLKECYKTDSEGKMINFKTKPMMQIYNKRLLKDGLLKTDNQEEKRISAAETEVDHENDKGRRINFENNGNVATNKVKGTSAHNKMDYDQLEKTKITQSYDTKRIITQNIKERTLIENDQRCSDKMIGLMDKKANAILDFDSEDVVLKTYNKEDKRIPIPEATVNNEIVNENKLMDYFGNSFTVKRHKVKTIGEGHVLINHNDCEEKFLECSTRKRKQIGQDIFQKADVPLMYHKDFMGTDIADIIEQEEFIGNDRLSKIYSENNVNFKKHQIKGTKVYPKTVNHIKRDLKILKCSSRNMKQMGNDSLVKTDISQNYYDDENGITISNMKKRTLLVNDKFSLKQRANVINFNRVGPSTIFQDDGLGKVYECKSSNLNLIGHDRFPKNGLLMTNNIEDESINIPELNALRKGNNSSKVNSSCFTNNTFANENVRITKSFKKYKHTLKKIINSNRSLNEVSLRTYNLKDKKIISSTLNSRINIVNAKENSSNNSYKGSNNSSNINSSCIENFKLPKSYKKMFSQDKSKHYLESSYSSNSNFKGSNTFSHLSYRENDNKNNDNYFNFDLDYTSAASNSTYNYLECSFFADDSNIAASLINVATFPFVERSRATFTSKENEFIRPFLRSRCLTYDETLDSPFEKNII